MPAPILSFSSDCHDDAACLVRDGEVVAAAQQARFYRKKHNLSFPADTVHSRLEAGRAALGDVDHVVFSDKPLVKTNLRFSDSLQDGQRHS